MPKLSKRMRYIALILFILIIVVLIFPKPCDWYDGWSGTNARRCDCYGIEITIQDDIAVDGDRRTLCFGIAKPCTFFTCKKTEDLRTVEIEHPITDEVTETYEYSFEEQTFSCGAYKDGGDFTPDSWEFTLKNPGDVTVIEYEEDCANIHFKYKHAVLVFSLAAGAQVEQLNNKYVVVDQQKSIVRNEELSELPLEALHILSDDTFGTGYHFVSYYLLINDQECTPSPIIPDLQPPCGNPDLFGDNIIAEFTVYTPDVYDEDETQEIMDVFDTMVSSIESE